MQKILTNETHRGISLLEILLVIGILAIIASISTMLLGGFTRSVDVRVTTETIRADLTEMRTRARSGDMESVYGAHFVHPTIGNSYYELIQVTYATTTSTSTLETITLPNRIAFTTPTVGDEVTVVFSAILGRAASTSISLSDNINAQETISITNEGAVR